MPDKNKSTDPEITGDARIDELLERVRKTSVGKSVSASEWDEIVQHIGENLMTDDRIMKEYDCGRKTGLENAASAAEAKLLDLAADEFKAGKDDAKASSMRRLAKQIGDHLKTLVPKKT
jgi:hypothetical protein